ncbi:hypothetical protein DFS34DRAFT_642999 [Phlyctochytrium arcticum]|nr:hypothetical protein DFS34DRAFT_642999 [Phlyctochytrium arcticum]
MTSWLFIYFVLNLSLTIFNKAVMQLFNFPYPWTLTSIHTACSSIGCQLCTSCGLSVPKVLEPQEKRTIIAFSVLYTLNIAVSNVSLNMVTIPFHQVIRSTVPVFTIALSVLFFKKSYESPIYFSLLPTVVGVCLATFGDYQFTRLGLILTLTGTILAAAKTVITNHVLVGPLKLHPLDLLHKMSPLAFIQTILLAYCSGEIHKIRSLWWSQSFSPGLTFVLIANGIIAFALNFVSFSANKETSALTMGVAVFPPQMLSAL